MARKRGYVLLGLLVFITVLGLSGTVSVLEQDTRLKRFQEDDLKNNIDTLRRGIDLYRYKYKGTPEEDLLDDALQSGIATKVIDLLANESFLRARIATGTMKWRMVTNHLKNTSFEDDSGEGNVVTVGAWTGNFTANDGVPDGWQLNSDGIEQYIQLQPGTYVASYWARAASATAKVHLKVWGGGAIPLVDLAGSHQNWKRHYGSFSLAAPTVVRVEIVQNSTTSGDVAFIDGIMLETWTPPSGAPPGLAPAPSAWTKDITIVPDSTLSTMQKRQLEDLLPAGATSASMTYWFEW